MLRQLLACCCSCRIYLHYSCSTFLKNSNGCGKYRWLRWHKSKINSSLKYAVLHFKIRARSTVTKQRSKTKWNAFRTLAGILISPRFLKCHGARISRRESEAQTWPAVADFVGILVEHASKWKCSRTRTAMSDCRLIRNSAHDASSQNRTQKKYFSYRFVYSTITAVPQALSAEIAQDAGEVLLVVTYFLLVAIFGLCWRWCTYWSTYSVCFLNHISDQQWMACSF